MTADPRECRSDRCHQRFVCLELVQHQSQTKIDEVRFAEVETYDALLGRALNVQSALGDRGPRVFSDVEKWSNSGRFHGVGNCWSLEAIPIRSLIYRLFRRKM